MKTRLLLLFITVFSISIAKAQTRVQQDDNTVTFILDDTVLGDEWDANGDPVYLYLYIDSAGASNGVASEPLGVWPGTPMIDLGGDIYKITIDLSNFYPTGTRITEILFTYNDNMGNQNPAVDGFRATNFSFVPFITLSTLDIERNNNTFSIIKGQLMSSNNENVTINIYNLNGQLVKTLTDININTNSHFDLNLNKNTVFFVQIESEKGIQVIKTIH